MLHVDVPSKHGQTSVKIFEGSIVLPCASFWNWLGSPSCSLLVFLTCFLACTIHLQVWIEEHVEKSRQTSPSLDIISYLHVIAALSYPHLSLAAPLVTPLEGLRNCRLLFSLLLGPLGEYAHLYDQDLQVDWRSYLIRMLLATKAYSASQHSQSS